MNFLFTSLTLVWHLVTMQVLLELQPRAQVFEVKRQLINLNHCLLHL